MPFGKDEPFKLCIRRIPGDVADKIDKRHKGKEQFEVSNGVRRPVHDVDGLLQGLIDKAIWAWVDAEGLQIIPSDEESVKLWGSLLTRDLKVGEVIDLQGKALTAEAKRRLMLHHRPFARVDRPDTEGGVTEVEEDLARFIVMEAGRLQRDYGRHAETLAGNSPAG
jgi:hypothetical protein